MTADAQGPVLIDTGQPELMNSFLETMGHLPAPVEFLVFDRAIDLTIRDTIGWGTIGRQES